MEKTCSKCGEMKHLDLFRKDSRRPQGFASVCKVCTNLEQKKYSESRNKAIRKYEKTEKGKLARARVAFNYELRRN